jgi:hypothetical protein
MGPKKKKKSAVRMVEQLIRMTVRSSGSSMSGNETGRLAENLHGYLRLLRKLAESDPDERFWRILHRVNVKVLRHLLQAQR